jgi:glycosyltransferase involved in cell wall biosynthesis
VSDDGPLVSLVMAAWRPREDWLRSAVDSALGQTRCNVEVVVVDDGSPDPVEDALSELRDPRLRVVRAEHGGECAARNRGFAEARGEYVRFIDADDVLVPDSTARLLALNGGRDDVIAYGATSVCDADLRPLWKMVSRVQGDALEACLLGRFTVRVFSMLFPRRVVQLAGEWDGAFRVSHDWDFVLRALEHATVRGDDATATLYRKHADAATTDVAAGEAGARRAIDKYFERHPAQRETRLRRRADARLNAIAARVLVSRGRRREAAGRFGSAVVADPTSVWAELVQGLPAVAGRARKLASRA